ncbi:unnamed protein product [Brugia timori]|uniref:Uncharacterized protein n=1 Tax=Brugia timori TaxID=42155 RepID=A0A0R3QPM3_9BILA|nr:unnamed protein product [Brugia timori]
MKEGMFWYFCTLIKYYLIKLKTDILLNISFQSSSYDYNYKQFLNIAEWIFRFDLVDQKWICTRDNISLDILLNNEFRKIFETEKIDFSICL